MSIPNIVNSNLTGITLDDAYMGATLTIDLDNSANLTAGTATFNGNVPSTSTTTGTVVVTGGLGVSGTMNTNSVNCNTLIATNITIGSPSLIPNSFVYPAATGFLTSTAAATNGQLLIGSTGVAPVKATLSAGSGIGITNAAGSITVANTGALSITGTANQVVVSASTGAITLSLPQSIASTSSPSFAGLTVTSSASITAPTMTSVVINSGAINGTTVGATTASTGAFTTLTATQATSANTATFTSSGSTNTLKIVDTGTNGANIAFTGNGATTPSKFIRCQGGIFGIINSAYTSVLLSLSDSGNLSVLGAASASGNDALTYQNSSGLSIPNNSGTNITGWTVQNDKIGTNFNASTGVFTAPVTGFYFITAAVTFAANAAGFGTVFSLSIIGNLVTIADGTHYKEAANSANTSVQVSGVVALSAGQGAVIQAFQNSGGSIALASTAAVNYISICKLM